MSMYIFQFLSDSPYVDMDPRPDAEVSKLIANGTIPTINKYFNSLCARNKIISFKGMVPEFFNGIDDDQTTFFRSDKRLFIRFYHKLARFIKIKNS